MGLAPSSLPGPRRLHRCSLHSQGATVAASLSLECSRTPALPPGLCTSQPPLPRRPSPRRPKRLAAPSPEDSLHAAPLRLAQDFKPQQTAPSRLPPPEPLPPPAPQDAPSQVGARWCLVPTRPRTPTSLEATLSSADVRLHGVSERSHRQSGDTQQPPVTIRGRQDARTAYRRFERRSGRAW